MKKVVRLDTKEEAYSLIQTIIDCKGSKVITQPLKSTHWLDNTLYGYLVFVTEDEQECISQDLIDRIQYIPDGLINEYV